MHQHVFVGGNFFMQRVLNQYRDDLGHARVAARDLRRQRMRR